MTFRPTRSRSRSSASRVWPASRNWRTASCSSRSALPVSWWNPYSSPRACSTVSRASESLPRAVTVSSSRSGRERSVMDPSLSSAPLQGPAASMRAVGQGGPFSGGRRVDQLLGQLPAVRRRTVGTEQPAGEVHAVDDQVDLRGEVLTAVRDQLVGEPLEPQVQLELVVGCGAAGRVLRVVVL